MHQTLKLAGGGFDTHADHADHDHHPARRRLQHADDIRYNQPDLPPVIQRAIARLMDPAFPVQINAPELKAMATLLRRVDKTDGTRQFWVKRVNLADMFGKCERTVTNWLNALEASGLIVKEQGRSGWGRFQSAILQLTPLAVQLLGLDQPLKKLTPGDFSPFESDHRQLEKKTSPRLCDTAFEFQSSSKRQLAEKLSTDPKFGTGTQFRDAQDRWKSDEEAGSSPPGVEMPQPTADQKQKHRVVPFVPDDCLPLLEMKITPFGVYKLMKEARLAGKRLSDIVSARLDALKAARNSYSLLVHLIHDGLDYTTIAKWQNEAHAKATQDKQEEVFQKVTGKRWLPGQWLVVPEPGVELKACRHRVKVHKEGPLELYEWANGALSYKSIIAGADLYAFWRGEGKWSTLQPLQPLDTVQQG